VGREWVVLSPSRLVSHHFQLNNYLIRDYMVSELTALLNKPETNKINSYKIYCLSITKNNRLIVLRVVILFIMRITQGTEIHSEEKIQL
jgi:hypothetical protein